VVRKVQPRRLPRLASNPLPGSRCKTTSIHAQLWFAQPCQSAFICLTARPFCLAKSDLIDQPTIYPLLSGLKLTGELKRQMKPGHRILWAIGGGCIHSPLTPDGGHIDSLDEACLPIVSLLNQSNRETG
jgi:hypothetical protein